MTGSPIETNNVVKRLETAVRALDWKAPVPDDLQSEIRMVFNEALAGGPNMNGDGGPTLTPNHALDCVWATQRIQSLSDRIDVLTEALRQIQTGADRGIRQFKEQQRGRSPVWLAVNILMDNLAACYGTALAALIKVDSSASLTQGGK